MAYVNVAEWKPDQVTDWLKGLDNVLVPYIHSFLNNQVNGQQILNLGPDDLEHLGVFKLGHQELILEAVEHLRHFHYELDRETLQILALRLSCLAHSLHNDLNRNHLDSLLLSTQTLADVANIVTAVKPLVCWLDRPPFSGQLEYSARKSELLSLSLGMATCGQRDRFAEQPVEEIRTSSGHLAVLADSIIQDIQDPLLLQPASLELVTLKKRSSDDLGFYIVPSYHGIHQIGELKLSSAAHQSGKLEPGDEIVQINYQTVVGWQVKQVMALFEESPTEVLLTVKKRPKHTKVYGQIYMKPYRLPSKKRATQNSFTRWHDNLPSPRPELLTIPDFEMPLPKSVSVESTISVGERLPSSSEEECELVDGNVASSPTSVRLYLPKPRLPVQRRATITGASPLSKRAPVNLQQFWEELKLEREWRGVSSSDKPRVAQLIQNCESRVNYARKYSSFDSLKDRNASCFLQDSKPDVVSSCQEREKSLIELLTSTQSTENTSADDKDLKTDKLTRSGSDEVFKTSEVTEKSSSDSVFQTVESFGRSSKRSSEIDEVFKSVDNNSLCSEDVNGHSRNKSVDSDSVFTSDNEKSEQKVSSLKERIELFSKASVHTDKPQPLKKIKPKVPARTFRLTPDNNTPAKVLAEVIKDNIDDTNKEESSVIVKQESSSKENITTIAKQEPIRKEKGRLDKSYSTPAYDMSAEVTLFDSKVKLQNILNPITPVQLKSKPVLGDSKNDITEENISKTSSSQSLIDSVTDSEKEEHGQIVETINKHLLRMDDETEVEPKWKDQKTSTNLDVDPPDETETEEKIGKILETLNSSLVERRKEMERESKVRKQSEGVDLSKTISQVCQEEILQTYNPSGFSPDNKNDTNFVNDGKIKNNVSNLQVLPRVRITPPSVYEENSDLPDIAITNQPPKTPKRKPTSNFDCVDKPSPPAPATFPRQKVDVRRPLTPPEPPPRPSLPISSISNQTHSVQQQQHKGACYRAMMAARSVGKSASSKASSIASPKAHRKKNPLLAKHRNISVKELGMCECQGWLQQRCRKGSGQWNRGWFLIKGTTFYGFKKKEANRAEVMISLPGFTVSAAEEVKSRKFAFKVYHTGTMFYFAADNQEELTAWVDSVTMATLSQDSHSDAILFSESEGEPSADEGGGESCFSSPKMKKFAGLLSSPTKQSPHPNTHADKSSDMQKKFGSLKKLRGKNDHGEHSGDCSSNGSSLDRKYLGFLGRGPSVPVPTAQFRSYRRVAPPLPRPLHQSAESVLTLDTRNERKPEI